MEVIVGVISGIIVSFLIFLGSLISYEFLIPWYQSLLYKGVDLKGQWTAEYRSEDDSYRVGYLMNISQNAHSLKGEMIVTKKRQDKKDELSNFDLEGKVGEGYVTLNLESKDKTRLSFATELLQVQQGGRALDGFHLFRSLSANEIRSIRLAWNRTS